MGKGKSGQSLMEKQQSIIDSFDRTIRQEKRRDWLNATEQAILEGQKMKAYQEKQQKKSTPFISTYNPNNPLNGSSNWNAQQWETYKLNKKNNKQSK